MKKKACMVFITAAILLSAGCNVLDKYLDFDHDSGTSSSSSTGTSSSASSIDGLVGEWLFNGNANDSSGYGNNGTINGAVLTNDRFGNTGNAYYFDGVNDNIMVNNSSSLCVTNETVSVWVCPVGKFAYMINKGRYGIESSFAVIIMDNSNIVVDTTINGTWRRVPSSQYVTDGAWYHIAWTYDSSSLKIYLNGILHTNLSISGNIAQNTSPLYFGCDYNNSLSYFKGILDDVRIYNCVLSSNEIVGLFSDGGWKGTCVYSNDFSSSPGWSTSDPSRFYWDSTQQSYNAHPVNIDYGGNYAVKDLGINMKSQSFRLEYDIKPVSVDYACGINFGLFDSDMNSDNNGSFAFPVFSHEDRGYTILTYTMNSNNQSVNYDSVSDNKYSLNVWYHVVMSYNAVTKNLSTVITNRDTGSQVSSYSIITGPFASDMDRIGFSDVRSTTYQVNGAQSTGYVDNVRLYIK